MKSGWSEQTAELRIPLLNTFKDRLRLFWEMVIKKNPIFISIQVNPSKNDVTIDWVKGTFKKGGKKKMTNKKAIPQCGACGSTDYGGHIYRDEAICYKCQRGWMKLDKIRGRETSFKEFLNPTSKKELKSGYNS